MQQLSCNIGLFPNKKCWQCKTKKVFFKNSNQFGSKRHLELTIENIGLYLDEKHQTLTNWYWWELGNCSLLFRKYLRLSSSFCKYVWVRCNTIIIIALIGTHIKATFVPFTVFFYIQSCNVLMCFSKWYIYYYKQIVIKKKIRIKMFMNNNKKVKMHKI